MPRTDVEGSALSDPGATVRPGFLFDRNYFRSSFGLLRACFFANRSNLSLNRLSSSSQSRSRAASLNLSIWDFGLSVMAWLYQIGQQSHPLAWRANWIGQLQNAQSHRQRTVRLPRSVVSRIDGKPPTIDHFRVVQGAEPLWINTSSFQIPLRSPKQ